MVGLAGLLLLVVAAALAAALARQPTAPQGALLPGERTALWLFLVVKSCVGAGLVLAAVVAAAPTAAPTAVPTAATLSHASTDSGVLLACALGPLLLVLHRSQLQRLHDWGLALAAGALLVGGLLGQALVLLQVLPACGVRLVEGVLGSIAVIVGLALTTLAARAHRRLQAESPGALTLRRSGLQVLAASIFALAGLLLAAPVPVVAPAAALAVAVAVAVAWRAGVQPAPAPLGPALALVVGAGAVVFVAQGLLGARAAPSLAVLAQAQVQPLVQPLVAVVAVAAALASLAWALVQLLPPWAATGAGLERTSPAAPAEPGKAGALLSASDRAVVDSAALAGMAAIVDGVGARSVARPRLTSRTPARRLLEAAIQLSQASAPTTNTSTSRSRAGGPAIDVVGQDADADIDGDAAALADAFAAALAAVGLQRPAPARLRVQLKGGVQQVVLEVHDDSDPAQPVEAVDASDASEASGAPTSDSAPAELAPGLDPLLGLAVARARHVVERHGGTWVGGSGASVVITLPRRAPRGGPVGQA
jgi:hypothetical protein